LAECRAFTSTRSLSGRRLLGLDMATIEVTAMPRFLRPVLVVLASGAIAACGSSTTPTPTAPPITPAEQSALVTAEGTASTAVTTALLTSISNLPSGAGTVNATAPCPQGGSVQASGPITGTPDGTGTGGTITATSTLTYAACSVATVVLNGGPITIKGQLVVVAEAIQNPVTFTISGTHNFTVDAVQGTITFNCTNNMVIDPDTLAPTSVTATGSASLDYPAGQNPTTLSCQTFANAISPPTLGRTVGRFALVDRRVPN
jgi:hypothetical protein